MKVLIETEQSKNKIVMSHQEKTAESYFTWKFNSWIIQFWTKFHENWKIKKKVWHCVLATVHALPAEAKLEGEWNQRVRHFSHHIVVRSVQLPPVLLLRGFPHLKVLRFWNFKFLKSGLFSAFFSKMSVETTKFEKIFVVILTRESCSVHATAYVSKSWRRFFKTNVVEAYYTNFNIKKILSYFCGLPRISESQNKSGKQNWRVQHNNSF